MNKVCDNKIEVHPLSMNPKNSLLLPMKQDIRKIPIQKANILSGTLATLNRNEDVLLSLLLRISTHPNCNVEDICEAVHETS